MNALETCNAQKARDRKHHEERVAWLSEAKPRYADGTRVAGVDVHNWLMQSRACLADPTGSTGYNTGPKADETEPRYVPSDKELEERDGGGATASNPGREDFCRGT